jgi:hypothetical protein
VTKLGLTYLNVVSYYAVANLSSSLPHVSIAIVGTNDTRHLTCSQEGREQKSLRPSSISRSQF